MSQQRRSLVVLGGGGHARVVIEAAREADWKVQGFVDPAPCTQTSELLQVDRLGDDSVVDALLSMPELALIWGIGGYRAVPFRVRQSAVWLQAQWAQLTHPTAWVASSAHIKAGSFVSARAVVQAGARVGAHCIVNTGAIVEHDAAIDDFVHLAPGSTLGGSVTIGPRTLIGLGATVLPGCQIGQDVVIGAGAVVTRDVPDGVTVMGVPGQWTTPH